jgi:hypothetical protein
MTTMPRELARKQPANLPAFVLVDEIHSIASDADLQARVAELARQSRKSAIPGLTVASRSATSQDSRGQALLLRVVAFLFLAGAVFQMVCAATGYRL